MPFKSEAQRRFLWAKHPEIAQRWANEEKKMDPLKKTAVRYGRPKKKRGVSRPPVEKKAVGGLNFHRNK